MMLEQLDAETACRQSKTTGDDTLKQQQHLNSI